ncbi:hypothetical protein AGMMS49546_17740 [Spirochaetia bacterium]|nr:hypothetical protein AGMMS49546_17740 [Spirochaetia bacterium]
MSLRLYFFPSCNVLSSAEFEVSNGRLYSRTLINPVKDKNTWEWYNFTKLSDKSNYTTPNPDAQGFYLIR